MPGINTMIDKWSKLNVRKVAQQTFEGTKKELEEFQIGQMITGVKADGKKIGKYKSFNYATYKYNFNTLAGFGFIDLRLTGDFYKGVFAEIKASSVVFFSKDAKASKLDDTYHPFGLTAQSRATYSKKFFGPVFQKKVKSELSKL